MPLGSMLSECFCSLVWLMRLPIGKPKKSKMLQLPITTTWCRPLPASSRLLALLTLLSCGTARLAGPLTVRACFWCQLSFNANWYLQAEMTMVPPLLAQRMPPFITNLQYAAFSNGESTSSCSRPLTNHGSQLPLVRMARRLTRPIGVSWQPTASQSIRWNARLGRLLPFIAATKAR